MHITTRSSVIAALLTASSSSCAFWGGPAGGNWFEDFMGGGFCDFGLNTGGRSGNRERGYGYRGYGPYPGGYVYPYTDHRAPYGTAPYGGVPATPVIPAVLVD